MSSSISDKATPITSIAITATFTAEPVEKTLRFWLQELQMAARISFAPYNQVFQQLLDPTSVLSNNPQGINVVLVRLEDWGPGASRGLEANPQEKERLLAGRLPYKLPNQLEIAQVNGYETSFMYQEIFVEQSYLKHGVTLRDGDCVFDVGANVGLFTLFVRQMCKDARIYAFEPAPPLFESLQINSNLYASSAKNFNCGLSDENKNASFTYYPRSSVFSGYYANSNQDEKAIRAIIENMLSQEPTNSPGKESEFSKEFLKGRLECETYATQLRTLSSIIEEEKIERIDLLKIDAEKSEWDILNGIEADDWDKIKQVVLEVHDENGAVVDRIAGLLKDKGFEVAVNQTTMLEGSGLYGIYATRPASRGTSSEQRSGEADGHSEIERNVADLVAAIKGAVERSPTPYLVCMCPSLAVADSRPGQFYLETESRMEFELGQIPGVHVVTSAQLAATYPVAEIFDPTHDRLAHVPFTAMFFAALGTMIVRKIYALKNAPYKVIALDADQTLWSGICGEDGAMGVQIDASRQAFQQALKQQHGSGMLLCLCSNNNDEDVAAVFERRPEMVLRREHFAGWRANWKTKSENLKSLARELQLGLDSFICLDDDPVACAEVQANCPEVLTLLLPRNAEAMAPFVRNIWAFDRLKVTQEGADRSVFYRQSLERKQFQMESLVLEDFLAGLGLRVYISPLASQHLARAAELTHRTNQFNVTTIRRSESELQHLCRPGGAEGLVVHVKDRFGDYGLVGFMTFTAGTGALVVDTFLLSCRALGRGVEHRMLAHLGALAVQRQVQSVMIPLIRSPKNQPAMDFLESVIKDCKEPRDDGFMYRFPADQAAAIRYRPSAAEPIRDPSKEGTVLTAFIWDTRAKAALLCSIAAELSDVEQIQALIAAQTRTRPESKTVFVAPRTASEQKLAGMFSELLGIEQIGINDNFFDLGGHSLLATQLISRLRDVFQVEIPIAVLFTGEFTVAKLAQTIAKYQIMKAVPEDIAAVVKHLDTLSDDEVRKLLADQ